MKRIVIVMLLVCMMQHMYAQETSVEVGGAPMYSSKSIGENLANSNDHTTLMAAIKASGLVNTLRSGSYTLFAPTNAAFNKLPKGTIEKWLKPENRATLVKLLTYHMVPGKLDINAIVAQIRTGGGTAMLNTVSGSVLKASMEGDKIVLTDEKGNRSMINIRNVYQSNGMIQVVDTVLQPS